MYTLPFTLLYTNNGINLFLFTNISIGPSLYKYSVVEGKILSIRFTLELSTNPISHKHLQLPINLPQGVSRHNHHFNQYKGIASPSDNVSVHCD